MSIADKIIRAKNDYDEVYEAGKKAEYDAFWDAYQWNGTRVDYHQAFGGKGWRESNFKPKYDVIPIGADNLFFWFNYDGRFPKVDLKKVFEERGLKLDFSQGIASFYRCFYRSRILRVGVIDLSNNTTTSFSQMFYGSTVEEIEKFVVSETQDFSTAFEQCTELKHIVIGGTIGKKVNFKDSPLTKESITSIVEHLSSTTTGQTATFKKSAKEAAFTADEWAELIADKTNWTLSLI
jgi:hypothetical protein